MSRRGRFVLIRSHMTRCGKSLLLFGALWIGGCGNPVPRLPGKTVQEQILWAAKYSDAAGLETVLKAGANPDERDPNNDWTPVIWSAVRGCVACIDVLAAHGADLEARGRRGQSALILATRWGQTESVRALLRRGASVTARDRDGWSALIWAAYLNRLDIARELLEQGASPNQTADDGMTALMVAARRGHDQLADLLLDDGAEAGRLGPMGKNAADIAAAAGYSSLSARLRPRDRGR